MWVSSNQTNDAELHSVINNQVDKQNAKSQMETTVLKKKLTKYEINDERI